MENLILFYYYSLKTFCPFAVQSLCLFCVYVSRVHVASSVWDVLTEKRATGRMSEWLFQPWLLAWAQHVLHIDATHMDNHLLIELQRDSVL